MHADKVCTASAKPASIGRVPCFLSACICVHLRLNAALHPSVLTYRSWLIAFQCQPSWRAGAAIPDPLCAHSVMEDCFVGFACRAMTGCANATGMLAEARIGD